MRGLSVRVLDDADVVCREHRIYLSSDYQRHEIARSKLVDQRLAVRAFRDRTIQTDKQWSHAVTRDCTAAVGNRYRNLRRQVIFASALIGSNSTEVKPTLARLKQWRIRRQENFIERVCESVMQPARHAIPEGAQVFR